MLLAGAAIDPEVALSKQFCLMFQRTLQVSSTMGVFEAVNDSAGRRVSHLKATAKSNTNTPPQLPEANESSDCIKAAFTFLIVQAVMNTIFRIQLFSLFM